MKKSFYVMMLLLGTLFTMASCEKETVLSEADTPAEIKTYVNAHFPGNTIVQIRKDKEGRSVSYDVILQTGVKLEFDSNKKIKDIESATKLPDSVIPATILNYVAANYNSFFIIGWELDGRNQQVKLNNGLELEFTMEGLFVRIDT